MATDTETNELALPILDPGDSEERVRKMLAHLFPEVAAQHATAVSEAETRLAAESVVGKARQAGFRVKNLALLRDKELCQRPSKAAQVWPSKIAHLAEVTSL